MRIAGYLVLALVSFCSTAQADIVCADKGGRLSIRATCKKGESPISFGALGIIGAQGPKGEKGDTGDGVFFIFDSEGKKIAPFVGDGCPGFGFDGNFYSFMEIDGTKYQVCFNKDYIATFDQFGYETYFTSTDCTGDGYLDPRLVNPSLIRPIRSALLVGPKATVFKPSPGSTPETVVTHSFYQAGVCKRSDNTVTYIRSQPGVNLAELYPPPYSIK